MFHEANQNSLIGGPGAGLESNSRGGPRHVMVSNSNQNSMNNYDNQTMAGARNASIGIAI